MDAIGRMKSTLQGLVAGLVAGPVVLTEYTSARYHTPCHLAYNYSVIPRLDRGIQCLG